MLPVAIDLDALLPAALNPVYSKHVGNIVVGILGALVFGLLFGGFNLLSSPMLNEMAGGTLGAVVLLVVPVISSCSVATGAAW